MDDFLARASQLLNPEKLTALMAIQDGLQTKLRDISRSALLPSFEALTELQNQMFKAMIDLLTRDEFIQLFEVDPDLYPFVIVDERIYTSQGSP